MCDTWFCGAIGDQAGCIVSWGNGTVCHASRVQLHRALHSHLSLYRAMLEMDLFNHCRAEAL